MLLNFLRGMYPEIIKNLNAGCYFSLVRAGYRLRPVRATYDRDPGNDITDRQLRECEHRKQQKKSLDFYSGTLVGIGRNRDGGYYITIVCQQRRENPDSFGKWKKYAYRCLSEVGFFKSIKFL